MSHHGDGAHHGHGLRNLAFGALALTAVAMVFGPRAAAGVARLAAALFLLALGSGVAFIVWHVFLKPDALPGVML